MSTLDEVAAEARACTVCAAFLPLGPRPIFRVSPTARLIIASQAPSTGAHRSGTPWTDASGERLCGWLGLEMAEFHDPRVVAILPTGFCYPGRLPAGGDAPPRPECAPLWHPRLLPLMPDVKLILLVGGYAQTRALGPGTMTERVREYARFLPRYFSLPHPSWRTEVWERRNPWFAVDVLPALRAEVRRALTGD